MARGPSFARPAPLSMVLILGLVAFLAGAGQAWTQTEGGLSAADRTALAALRTRYTSGWLADRPETVLDTFTDDALLMPDSSPSVQGRAAIRDFFWPEGAGPTGVVLFELKSSLVRGVDTLAYDHGTYRLELEIEGRSETVRAAGEYLAVARRDADGVWRWAAYSWDLIDDQD